MKPNILNRFLLTQLLAAACITSAAHAASGTWNDITGGLWSDTANWNSGIVADGNTFNANFGTLDITADTTVSLDSARTLSSLTFGDTTTSTAAGWILDNNGNAANILTLGTTPTITVNALGIGKNVTISAELAGSAGMTKAGAGTLVLTAANSYTGTTTISGGTLALSGGNNRLTTGGTVNFSAAGTLDLGSTQQTLANLTTANGVTGTVNGSGGKLTLTGSSFALGSATAGTTQTLNLSGLSTFEYNNAAGTFRVAGIVPSGGAGSAGVMSLASGTNTITASTFGIADFVAGSNTSVNQGTVNLGTTNTVNANTIVVGGGSRAAGTLRYLSGTNTLLTLRGSDGTSAVTSMTVGEASGPALSGQQGTVDLTTNVTGTSTLDAKITTLTIGKNTRSTDSGGNAIINAGTFTMGAGTLDATTIILAQNTAGHTNGGSTSKVTGNLTVTGGTIKVGDFYFADQKNSSSTSSALEANFNLNSGANLYAANIAKGVGTGTKTATRTFNWNDGTIRNYDSSTNLTIGTGITVKLAATGTHTFNIDSNRTATVDSVLSDATTLGTLTKAGDGKLTLNAINTYTGATSVTGGTLLVNGSTHASSAFTVGASGTLGGTGAIGGTVSVDGTLAPGASIESLSTGAVTFNNNSTFAYELNSAALGGDLLNTEGALSLTNTVTLTLNELSTGTLTVGDTLTLISYDTTWNGGLFAYADGNDGTLTDGETFTLGNNQFVFDYNNTSGGSNFSGEQTGDNRFVTMTVVPEPAAALLGSLGLLAMLRRRRN